MQSKGGTQLIRGILQLLEEWEYHFALAGVAHHSVKAMLAKNIDGPSRDPTRDRDTGEEGGKHQEQVRGTDTSVRCCPVDRKTDEMLRCSGEMTPTAMRLKELSIAMVMVVSQLEALKNTPNASRGGTAAAIDYNHLTRSVNTTLCGVLCLILLQQQFGWV